MNALALCIAVAALCCFATASAGEKDESESLRGTPPVASVATTDEYIAFSLLAARSAVASSADYRAEAPTIFKLAGINQVVGLVSDQESGDLILVGRNDPERAPLTLDDLVVALRARFVHGRWPVVSIDPDAETPRTQVQQVRFEGGIENTEFGRDLLGADYLLKKLGMGLAAIGVTGISSYWDLSTREMGSRRISSRFWFYPLLPSVAVRDGVVAVRGLRVGVFTEVLAAEIDGKKISDLKDFRDAAADSFAETISSRFSDISRAHPVFSRLLGLDELVAISRAIEEMEPKPDLDYWLTNYQVRAVITDTTVRSLFRTERSAKGGDKREASMEGGVRLMAVALRLRAGDTRALRDAVLTTRPPGNAVSWTFLVGDWLIPTSPGMIGNAEAVQLVAHANFLESQSRHDDADALYQKLDRLRPDLASEIVGIRADALYGKALSRLKVADYDGAIKSLSAALKLRRTLFRAYYARAIAYERTGKFGEAMDSYQEFLALAPHTTQGYFVERARARIALLREEVR